MNEPRHGQPGRQPPTSPLSQIVLYLGFAATGVGMALPGAVLPALLLRWSLSDRQAGLLLFCGWLGSSLGALAVRPSRTRSLILGTLGCAAGALGMAFSNRFACYPSMFLFGLGLGITMTASSLLQAARHPNRRGAELNRLNLIWAIGACVCPTLAAHSLRIASARAIFSALGLFFALICLWTLAFEHNPAISAEPTSGRQWSLTLWPLSLVLVMLLPTGIEASMGGWIAAYVLRSQQTIVTTVSAATCFWVGLLLSRTLASTILLLRRSERLVLRQSLVTVVAGAILLIAGNSTLAILPGVFLVGFGLGPVYPLLLAIALQYSGNTTIFFIAGLGSSIFPWLTGLVSSSASSLRTGLLVPLAAAILMLILGFRVSFLSQREN